MKKKFMQFKFIYHDLIIKKENREKEIKPMYFSKSRKFNRQIAFEEIK